VGKKGCCWNICPDSLTFWLPLCHYDGQQLLDAEVTKTVMVNIYKLFKCFYILLQELQFYRSREDLLRHPHSRYSLAYGISFRILSLLEPGKEV